MRSHVVYGAGNRKRQDVDGWINRYSGSTHHVQSINVTSNTYYSALCKPVFFFFVSIYLIEVVFLHG